MAERLHEYQLRAQEVMHGGGMDDHFEQQPQRVDQQMPFTPTHLFAPVVPARPALLGLDRLVAQ